MNKTPRGLIVAAITLALMAVAGISSSFGAGRLVQDFSLPSATSGSLVRLADYAGKVVLINWWRSDCAWSQRETPRLAALYQKYRGRGFVILGTFAGPQLRVTENPR